MKSRNPKLSFFTVLLLLLLAAPTWVLAQAYNFMRFDEQHGLSEKAVYSIAQGEKGFLYLGTPTGLYRFDGNSFSVIRKREGLAENFVSTLFNDKEGTIWIGHQYGGISQLKNMKASTLLDSTVIRNTISGFAKDSKGNIWVATKTGGILTIDSTGNPGSPFKEELDHHSVFSIAITRDDQMLVATEEGLLVYKLNPQKKSIEFKYKSTKVPETTLPKIVRRHRRPGYWIATQDAGLVEFVPSGSDARDEVNVFGEESGLGGLGLLDVFEDDAEHVWVGTQGNGFRIFDDTKVDARMVPILPELSSDSIGEDIVKSIFQDKFGQIWLGTYGQGLICLSDETFNRFRIIGDSIGKVQILVTLEDAKGDLWLGTNKGIYVLDRETVRQSDHSFTFGGLLLLPYKQYFGPAQGLPFSPVTALYEDKNHRIWAGGPAMSIAYAEPLASTFNSVSLSDFSSMGNIKQISGDKRGNIWFASSEGARTYNPTTGKSSAFTTQNGLSHNDIFSIYPDSKGNIWICSRSNRVAVYDGKAIELVEIGTGGQGFAITSVVEDKDGNFWFGSSGGGLYRYDGVHSEQFDKEEGLLSNFVYQIVIDRYQNVWTTHREGMSRYIRETGKFFTYPTKDFFPLEENPITSAQIDALGNIWFGTEYGLLRYNWYPSRNKVDPPYIFLQEVLIGDQSYPADGEISLPYGEYDITLKYLGLTFIMQDQIKYQYRMMGRSPDWSDLTEQNIVSFQAVSDGDYVFQVRACNAFGNCNESPARISISITPPFWKTWWFRILIILLVVGIGVAYFRYRLFRLQKEKQELEEKVRERTQELLQEKEKVEEANIELEKLSLVASETDNAVFILDPKLDFVWVNNGFSRLTGLTLDELERIKGTNNFLESSASPIAKEMLHKALETKSSVQYESQLPSKSGKPIWVVSTLTPILKEDGSLRNVVIIDSNITERKEAEQRIREMNTELERLVHERTQELAETNQMLQKENEEHIKTAEALKVSNRELDTFVYRASHDLKGPTASMMGLVNIAGMELADNEIGMRYVGLLEKAAKRLDNILIDLIEATQVKQHTVQLEQLPVLEFSKEVVAQLQSLPNYGSPEVEFEIAADLQLVSDRKLLGSIIHNFLANAIRYKDAAKPEQKAKLRISQDQGHYLVEVEDNGIGVADDIKHRIFDMFFRGTNQSGGSGLGLYVVKKAAEKLDGEVDFSSQDGVGTKIWVKFPLQELPN